MLAYSIGRIISKKNFNENETRAILFSIVFGRFLHGFLNIVLYVSLGGVGRNPLDVWSGSIIAATLMSSLFTYNTSLMFYTLFVLKVKSEPLLKIGIISSIIIALITAFVTATRTQLFLSFIVFVICFISYSRLNKNSGLDKKYLTIILYVIIITVLIIISINLNIFDFKSKIVESPLYERFNNTTQSITDSERLKTMLPHFKNIILYPFGNNSKNYAHNLWLDVDRKTGIFPFILIILFTVKVLQMLYRMLKSERISIKLKMLYLSLIAGALINFTTEPVLEGMPFFFISLCMIIGMCDIKYGKEYYDKGVRQ
jgi:hypothetical protein